MSNSNRTGILYSILRQILFELQPETAHNIITEIGRNISQSPWLADLITSIYTVKHPALRTCVIGSEFTCPIGLAAGFDKKANLVDFIAMLGFGFTEVGSLSAKPVQGNPKPRIFRLPKDKSLINRMGLNNPGIEMALTNLNRQRLSIPFGINLVKTHDPSILGEAGLQDVLTSYRLACTRPTYIALNVSCPNTTEGKTFEDPEALTQLLNKIDQHRQITRETAPLFLKFSPDLTLNDIKNSVEISENFAIDGYILCNTTVSRDGLITEPETLKTIGNGGLSGPLLTEIAIERIRTVYKLLNGKKPIIGVGGIDSAETAYRFIRSGASLVELYTSFIYYGPSLPKKINLGLLEFLKRDGLDNISKAVGLDAFE